jgi:Holliday junction resolvase RusA-like endonuclease
MTQGDRWGDPRPPVARYWAFKDELTLLARQAGFELGQCPMMIFYVPMPQSWSQKKRREMNGQPKLSRPDTSNYVKACEDSLLPDEDSAIWFTVAAKFWATEGAIEIVNLTEAEARYILVRKDVTKIDN